MKRTTCRDVAFGLAQGNPGRLSADEVSRHLSGCPKCVAFERQLMLVNEAARIASLTFEDELPADFEARVVARLCS